MKISYNWLKNYFADPLPSVEEVADALTFHAFEIDGIDFIKTPCEDAVLDVKVTANRGHDCLSHRGIAAELSAILKNPLKSEYDPFAQTPDFSKKTGAVTVTIADAALCRRYIAGYVMGVKVGPSPEWLRNSLEAIGQRSINNVVDATNLVMFNIGQPLHAFDAKKLGSLDIGVRRAHDGEKITALDGQEYTLDSATLLITAGDAPAGIAGVKGGMATGIDETTTDIVLEAATFDGPTVRKAAAKLKLRSDASARFEQGLSPELAAYGMQNVIALITHLAGGEMQGFVDAYPSPLAIAPVSVSLVQINAVLGISLDTAAAADVFTRLALPFTQDGDTFTVTPPFQRLDLLIPEDLIEEVGRIVGYDTVPATELPPTDIPAATADFARMETIRAWLVSQGFSEVFTSVFADKGERVVANKVDGVRPYLRTNLSDGLADALERNIRIKDVLGVSQVRIFEIGTVWRDGKEEIVYDLAVEKIKKQKTADEYKQELEVVLHRPSELGHSMSYGLPDVQYRPFSRYPFIIRDIAIWTPAGTDADTVLSDIRTLSGELLVRSAIFDRFEKEGKISLAFRLVFQSPERTLVDDEVNAIMEKVSVALTARGFEIR